MNSTAWREAAKQKLVKKSDGGDGGGGAPAAGDTTNSRQHPTPSMSRKISNMVSSSARKPTLASSTSDGASSAGGSGRASGGMGTGTGADARRRAQLPFDTSDGAMRLNRILDTTAGGGVLWGNAYDLPSASVHGRRRQTLELVGSGVVALASSIAPIPSISTGANATGRDGVGGGNAIHGGNNHNDDDVVPPPSSSRRIVDYVPPSTVQLPDPTDEYAVGEMTCRISSKMRVDARSIGGRMLGGDGKVEARTGYVLMREGWEEMSSSIDGGGAAGTGTGTGGKVAATTMIARKGTTTAIARVDRLTNECLFSMCVSQFDLSVGSSGGPSGGKKRHIPIAKSRNKLRYVVVVRSTNRPLLRPKFFGADGGIAGVGGGGGPGGGAAFDDDYDDADDDDAMDDGGSDDGYDNMFNPDPSEGDDGNSGGGGSRGTGSSDRRKKRGTAKGGGADNAATEKSRHHSVAKNRYDNGIPPEREISSFPALFCLAIHADGTKPDTIRFYEDS